MTQELNTDPSVWLDHSASVGVGVEGNVAGLGREALERNPTGFNFALQVGYGEPEAHVCP